MEEDIETVANDIRGQIQEVASRVASLHNHSVFDEGDQGLQGTNVPANRNGNMHANITLAFRHLEDARMRLGLVMAAAQGGVSKFDREDQAQPGSDAG